MSTLFYLFFSLVSFSLSLSLSLLNVEGMKIISLFFYLLLFCFTYSLIYFIFHLVRFFSLSLSFHSCLKIIEIYLYLTNKNRYYCCYCWNISISNTIIKVSSRRTKKKITIMMMIKTTRLMMMRKIDFYTHTIIIIIIPIIIKQTQIHWKGFSLSLVGYH